MRPRWPPRRRWPPRNRMRDMPRGAKLSDSPDPSPEKPTSVSPPPSSDPNMGESVSPLLLLEPADDDHDWGEGIWSTDEETSHLLLVPRSETRSPLPGSSEAALPSNPYNTEQVVSVGEEIERTPLPHSQIAIVHKFHRDHYQ